MTACVAVRHDNRNRLIEGQRFGTSVSPVEYDLAYEYDIAGNRTQKVDALNDIVVDYVYDVSDPECYGSQGNRLMSSLASTISTGEPIEERWYTYDPMGNVELVIRRIAGDEDEFGEQWYRRTQLYYVKNGRLWISRSLRWQLDIEGQPINCEHLAAMEYRCDSGRQRYMVRPRNPNDPALDPEYGMKPYSADAGTWHDYDGDSIYGDYTISYDGETLNIFDTLAHEPGLAQYDHDFGALHHLHGDLIGTTGGTTDASGLSVHRGVHTAFGELVYTDGPVGTRYRFAGAWGYQACEASDPLSELGWLHVGERYYDPSTGRFVQRDPVGIRGGMNVYVYVGNNPVVWVDPLGFQTLMHPQSVALMIEMGWSAKEIAAATGITVATAAALIAARRSPRVTAAVARVVTACVAYLKEHTKGKSKSKSKRDKHQKGTRRLKQKYKDKNRQKPGWYGR